MQHFKEGSCFETLGHWCRGCQKKQSSTELRKNVAGWAVAIGRTLGAAAAALFWSFRVTASALRVVAAWLGL